MDRPTRLASSRTLAALHTFAALLALAALVALPATAAAQGVTYRVTVTNLTSTQILSPPVVVAHGIGLSLFTPGHPASHPLAVLAEDGDPTAMTAMLSGHPEVASFAVGEGIPPGASTIVEVQSHGRFVFLSMVSMLVTTNDGFAGLRLYDLRGGHWLREVLVEGWDAGSEANNEDCDFIPGPPCGSPMVRDTAGAEGFVGIHPGIRGIGDLAPEVWDWKNPVALVRIARAAGPAGS